MKQKKLAVVAIVHAVTDFMPAFNIRVAHILNKKVIVRKEDIDLGDKVVLIRENSILPDTEWSRFLGNDKRVRPHKFLKVKSDCLALPLSDFPELDEMNEKTIEMVSNEFKVGEDLTEVLNIKPWSPKKNRGRDETCKYN